MCRFTVISILIDQQSVTRLYEKETDKNLRLGVAVRTKGVHAEVLMQIMQGNLGFV